MQAKHSAFLLIRKRLLIQKNKVYNQPTKLTIGPELHSFRIKPDIA